MRPLEKSSRNKLEKTAKDAREVAEAGARAALEQMGVESSEAYSHLSEDQRDLRRRLRAHGRQLGDKRDATGKQEIELLAEETAYQHWHRMLFARFLAENDLLMYPDPDEPVAVTIEECEDMAEDEGAKNGWELAARYASRMLPQIFRQDSPVLELELPPEHQQKLETMLADLPDEVFTASDSIGWVYQFWQAKRKDEVNAAGVKIGARELPAVTQLFTEQYMVDFLLDNSLGAWWADRRLSPEDLKTAKTEEKLRQKVSIPGVPLNYLRFVKVTRASSSGASDSAPASVPVSSKVTRASSSGFSKPPAAFDESSLKKTSGENVPHWTCDNATYHVSFRLADAVPKSQTQQWLRERQSILDNAMRMRRDLTPQEEKKVRYLYSERIERYLDAGHGECHLANPKAAETVANALRFFEGKRYRLHAWCVMPNHVHVIVEPFEKESLSSIIHSWKSYTANECNKLLGLRGQFWQKDAYNHIIRTEKEYGFQIQYVWNNPEKAKLNNWRWRWRIDLDCGSLAGSDREDRHGSVSSGKPDQDGLVTSMERGRHGAGASDRPDQDGLVTLWEPAAGTMEGWPEHLGELKTLDPCCGSGHFLVSAFLMLVPMRMELESLSPREAVDRVLAENIHGLEIDKRCVELAAFSLALTAWRYPEAGGYRPLPEFNVACSGLSVHIPKTEWKNVARALPDKSYLPIALDWLHDQFKDAAVLGSLMDPAKAEVASLIDWDSIVPLLDQALKNNQSEETLESGVLAQGLAKCTQLLVQKYTWVITNVPYLVRGKQSEKLHKFCARHYKEAKNDLATVFFERCLQMCEGGGTTSVVLPQNWLFLTTYKKFREKLLKSEKWNFIARLGPGAFETISGEVVKAILIILSRHKGNQSFQLWSDDSRGARPGWFGYLRGMDVSDSTAAFEKNMHLRTLKIKSVEQVKQLNNPDARIVIDKIEVGNLLEKYAVALAGINTGDYPRWGRNFWEVDKKGDEWVFQQTTTLRTAFYSGLTQIFKWCGGKGEYLEYINSLNGRLGGSWKRGVNAWGMAGVVVSQMRYLPVAKYAGSAIDSNISAVIPNNQSHLASLYAFCSSNVFQKEVRKIDQKLNVTNATFSKVSFDLDYWKIIAEKEYPKGLPGPHSDDPTQWIFHGHPCDSVIWDEDKKWTALGPKHSGNSVLHVAIVRLLGYRWPAEYMVTRPSWSGEKKEPASEDLRVASDRPDQDGLVTSDAPEQDGLVAPDKPDQDGLATTGGMELADEAWELVKRAKELWPYADEDGIVCIPPVRGEMNAEDRLENLLAEAYGNEWSPSRKSELLKQADHAGKSMESWLRDRFFAQHCKLFQNRPFIWHIWDGLRDGFAALVNYHKLDYKNLETLIYTYLGDWIRCQRQDMADGIDGAEEKLAAAEALKKRLELILEGEAPYDIFVRWKPIEEQPIGWNPDLNDGVRLNIRPFMTVPDVKKKGAGVLRDKPNIKWGKDRGKDVPSAPWYDLGPKYGGKKGDRINDHHLTIAEKKEARSKKKREAEK